MNPADQVLLLCFRATGHYWPLAFRQLALPLGSKGESFPYRRPFVFGAIAEDIAYRALICMKYAKLDAHFNRLPTYIPLRWVQNCQVSPGTQGDLLTFGFTVDATVHYDPVPSMSQPSQHIATAHSQTIRNAVLNAMQAEGHTAPDDDDRALAIRVERHALEALYPSDTTAEDERWVNLTRLLSSRYLPGEQSFFPKQVVFTRLSRVRYLDLDRGSTFDTALQRFRLYVNRDIEVEVLSVSYPRAEHRLTLSLEVNPDEVVTVVGHSNLHAGAWIHRFALTPRAITDYTLLSFRVPDALAADDFATDFAVPATIQPLHRMEVIDASNPNSIRCLYYVSADRKAQPLRGAYLLADLHDPDTRKAVLVADSMQEGDAPDTRLYFLRLIGTVDGSAVNHWDGASLDGGIGPIVSAVHPEVDVSPFLEALCAKPSQPPGRCELLQVANTTLTFDLNVKKGFRNSHTAVFGQTGSGKSYSVGVLLEELLANNFKLLVLDPNSDFIHCADAAPSFATDPGTTFQYRKELFLKAPFLKRAHVFTTRHSQRPYWKPCTLSFADLSVRQQAGLIHLDRDRVDLYAEHKKVREQFSGGYRPEAVRAALKRSAELSPDSARRKLAALYSNYELDAMGIWADDAGTIIPELQRFYRGSDGGMMVVDLGSLRNADARLLMAGHLLEKLWELAQNDPKPVIIVVDEAHNLVTPEPNSELQVVTTELLNRIAAEGRKYGLNLLLMTQRPSKLHPNCLGMVSNLVCMKVTNLEDLDVIKNVFGNVPLSLFGRIPYLSQGQALVSGKLTSFPMLLRFGRRFTEEGIKEPA